MAKSHESDLMPDGFERERQANTKALWQCGGAFAALLALTILANVRPDIIASVLGGATALCLVLLLIGLQEAWRLRRGNPFK